MAGTRTPLMAGNWKMNLDHFEATHLVQKLAWTLQDAKHDFSDVEVVVLPPFTDLRSVQSLVDGDRLPIGYGAQDVSVHDEGAYTGEVSARMLSRLGCRYVVVGHSERRRYHGEDDALVGAKALTALRHDLVPIICIGEDVNCRKGGGHLEFCLAQVDAVFERLSVDQAARVVVAYEPVWAIGTGEVATPADAQELCRGVRERLGRLYDGDVADAVRVLYGGSVKAENVAAIMAEDDVDGALVGGASLDAAEFAAICRFQHHRVGL